MVAVSQNHGRWIQFALVLLMVLTRFHYDGGMMLLADASWAVFFLSGLYSASGVIFPVLIIIAGVIDYLAITMGGVSDWCVSGGYGFLIPTYGVLWLGGRFCRGVHLSKPKSLAILAMALLTSTTAAFLISNAGFYLFSDRFVEAGWYQYAVGVAKYFPHYLWVTAVYVAVALVVHAVITGFRRWAAEIARLEYDPH